MEKSDATVSLSKDGYDDTSSKQSETSSKQSLEPPRQPTKAEYEDWEQLVEDDRVLL
jgi:hypothetical protein